MGSVLTAVNSSHSAVFIYNKENEFIGLVSPYKTIYSSNYPYSTKVASIVFKPPMLAKTAKIYEVAKHMIATKMYMLPIFTKTEAVEGVVYGKDMLQEVIKDPRLLGLIKSIVLPHNPVTAPFDSLVKDLFNMLKEKGISKIILVDDNGAMKGIVTRRDLMQSVIKPTPKMRFANEGSSQGVNSFAGEKKSRKDDPAHKFASLTVSSLPDSTPMEEVVTHLIESPRNSVVLVDKQNIPTGMLSTRDILQAISLLEPKMSISVHIKKSAPSASASEVSNATKYLKALGEKLSKRTEIERIEVVTEEVKTPEGHVRQFNTNVMAILVKGDPLIAVTKNRIFLDGVQEAVKIIEKQQRREK